MRLRNLIVAGFFALISGILIWLLIDRLMHSSPSVGDSSNVNLTTPKLATDKNLATSTVVNSQPPVPAIEKSAGSSQQHPVALADNGQALPAVGTLLIESYPTLKVMADSGDVRAACRLAFELDRCSRSKQVENVASNLEFNLGKLDQKSPAYEGKLWLAKNARGEANIANSVCRGFTESNSDEGWKYALQAAQFGSPEMRVRYVRQQSASLDNLDPTATAEGWVAYRQNAPALLQRAIDEGSPEAFEFAAYSHLRDASRWRLVPRNNVAGLSYYIALLTVASPEYKRMLEQNIEWTISDKRTTDVEVAQARTAASSLVPKLVRVSPNSVDFSKGTFPNNNGSQCENVR
jgi:hypothetical protein